MNKKIKTADTRSEIFTAPRTKGQLIGYVRRFLKISISERSIIEGHQAPIDYLWYTYGRDFSPTATNGDCVVCANRGGGKTLLGAAATLLDCVFKPRCQVRILSGSEYQAGRMYEYFQSFVTMGYEKLVAKVIKWPKRKTIFLNGASVEVLTQSETSVRGPHVHKVRCDEVELFKPAVYEAAQYTTMSGNGLVGAFESISTMHQSYGLMKQALKRAQKNGMSIFIWNLWDVIERCEKRDCQKCAIWLICKGKAKNGEGYYRIDDAISQMSRTSTSSFRLEALCGQDTQKNSVQNWRRY